MRVTVEELAVEGGGGGDAQGVALAAPHGHPLVERHPLGGLQLAVRRKSATLPGMSRAIGSSEWPTQRSGRAGASGVPGVWL